MEKSDKPAIKLTFGAPPATFEKDVHTKLLNGTNLTFRVTFKYRNREQYGALLDSIAAKNSAPPVDSSAPVTAESIFADKAKVDAEAVLEMAQGWSLTDPFTLEHLTYMAINYPGVIHDIHETYRAAVVEGRAKN